MMIIATRSRGGTKNHGSNATGVMISRRRIIGGKIAAVVTATSRAGTTTMGRSNPSAGGMRIAAATIMTAGTKARVRVMIGDGTTIITSKRTIVTTGERTRAAVAALAGTTISSPRTTGGAMIIAHGTGITITTGAARRTVIIAAKPSGVTMKLGTETTVAAEIATAANGPTSAIVRETVGRITATSVSQVRRPIIIGSLIIIISGRTITRATTNATIIVNKTIIITRRMTAAMDTPIRIIITSRRSKNGTITTVQLWMKRFRTTAGTTKKVTIGRMTGKITIVAIRTSVRKAVVATHSEMVVSIQVVTTVTTMIDKMIAMHHKMIKPPSLTGMSGRKNAVKPWKTITLRMITNAVMCRWMRKFRTVATKKKTVASENNPLTLKSRSCLASEAMTTVKHNQLSKTV